MFSMYVLSLMHPITIWIFFLHYNTLHERIYKSSFTLQLVVNGADGQKLCLEKRIITRFLIRLDKCSVQQQINNKSKFQM